MKSREDTNDNLFERGIDKLHRRIFLFDDIDNAPIATVIKSLYLLDSENNKKPIELILGSYGGCIYDMFALYDTIQMVKSPIYTTAIGKCMSAAPLLVSCGKVGHRKATANTFFMVHQGWNDLGQKRYDETKNDLEHWIEVELRWQKLMGQHTKKSADFWKIQCEKVGDKYFDAYEAKEWGVIDSVLDKNTLDCNSMPNKMWPSIERKKTYGNRK